MTWSRWLEPVADRRTVRSRKGDAEGSARGKGHRREQAQFASELTRFAEHEMSFDQITSGD